MDINNNETVAARISQTSVDKIGTARDCHLLVDQNGPGDKCIPVNHIKREQHLPVNYVKTIETNYSNKTSKNKKKFVKVDDLTNFNVKRSNKVISTRYAKEDFRQGHTGKTSKITEVMTPPPVNIVDEFIEVKQEFSNSNKTRKSATYKNYRHDIKGNYVGPRPKYDSDISSSIKYVDIVNNDINDTIASNSIDLIETNNSNKQNLNMENTNGNIKVDDFDSITVMPIEFRVIVENLMEQVKVLTERLDDTQEEVILLKNKIEDDEIARGIDQLRVVELIDSERDANMRADNLTEEVDNLRNYLRELELKVQCNQITQSVDHGYILSMLKLPCDVDYNLDNNENQVLSQNAEITIDIVDDVIEFPLKKLKPKRRSNNKSKKITRDIKANLVTSTSTFSDIVKINVDVSNSKVIYTNDDIQFVESIVEKNIRKKNRVNIFKDKPSHINEKQWYYIIKHSNSEEEKSSHIKILNKSLFYKAYNELKNKWMEKNNKVHSYLLYPSNFLNKITMKSHTEMWSSILAWKDRATSAIMADLQNSKC